MPLSKSRSPKPPSYFLNSPSPRPFLPPSHYAAAAGRAYSVVNPPQFGETLSSEAPQSTTTPNQQYSPSPRRNSFVPISYPSQPISSESSFEFDAPVYASSIIVNKKPKPASESGSRAKRQSNLGDLPLLEAHLLPSLRDTIDRMTRDPSRVAASSPATSDPPAYERRPRSGTHSANPPTEPHTLVLRSQSAPQAQNLQTSLTRVRSEANPFAATLMPVETSTPKQKPKSTLKSALKSPTPKLQTQHMDLILQSPSPALSSSLRSVRSIIGAARRTPTPSQANPILPIVLTGPSAHNEAAITLPDKLQSKSLKGGEKAFATRIGRARSCTDPGIPLKSPATLPQPPATPQPRSTTSSLTHRNAFNSIPDRGDDTGESELEFQYEMESRERRRLVVTNASVVPSSSESESEAMARNFRTRLPVLTDRWGHAKEGGWKNAVGLGFGLKDVGVKGNEMLQGSDDDSSVYEDQEPEPDRIADSSGDSYPSFQSRSFDFDEAHRKRREALMGLVSGLELGLGSTFVDVTRSEESDYCGQEGLAISGSGDMGGEGGEVDVYLAQQELTKNGSGISSEDYNRASGSKKEEYDGDERKDITKDPSILPKPNSGVPTLDRRCKRSALPICSLPQREYVFNRSETLSPQVRYPTNTSSPRVGPQSTQESVNNTNKGRSPVIRQSVGIVIPDALKRYSVYEAPDPKSKTRIFCRDENLNVDAERTYARCADTVSQDENSYAAAARERKAFGIPPSRSDGVFECDEKCLLPHADSVLSSMDSTLWLEDCDELSVGAEELFRKLSGRSDGTISEQLNKQCIDKDVADPVSALRGSISQSSSASSVYGSPPTDPPWQDRDEDECIHDPSSKSGKWRSTLSKATYRSLLEQYGELEMQRQEIIWELWETEKVFVRGMKAMVELFIRPLRVQNARTWISGVPPDVARLFDWLEDIVNLHQQILSVLQASLDERSPIVECLSVSLRGCAAKLEVYQPYMAKLDEANGTIKHLRQEPGSDFGEFVKIQERAAGRQGWNLESFLMEPLNRLADYPGFFRKLKDLTPKNHPDFLPTFSLFHSTNMAIRVINEVKAREDQYDLIKDILAQIQGLPSSIQLARRERLLLAHGLLQRIEVDGMTYPQISSLSQSHANSPAGRDKSKRNSKLVEAINEWDVRRGRSGSVKSTSSSATGVSFKSYETNSSASSVFPITPSSEHFSSGYSIILPSPKSNVDSGYTTLKASNGYSRLLSKDTIPTSDVDEQPKTTSVHAFIFTDLILFTSPMTSSQAGDDGPKWCLLDDIGLARVLGVTEIPRTSTSGPLIALDLLPVDARNLDTGIHPDRSPVTSVLFSIPGDVRSESEASHDPPRTSDNIRQKWLSALEQCLQFALRSLSFPSHSGGYLMRGPSLDLELDARQSVSSILASGLPLPKSPSYQQREESTKGQINDTRQLERVERGWWSLRFQRVLREIQRQDIPYMD